LKEVALHLTAKRVACLLKKPGKYHDGRGLILQVRSQTNASWILRYQKNGKEHSFGLGPVWRVSLKIARGRARAAKDKLHYDGVDPIAEKKAKRAAQAVAAAKAMTFEAAALAYFNDHQKKWRNAKHREQFLGSMRRYAFPLIGALPVAEIDTALVLKVLEQKHADHADKKLWLAIPETASRVRNRLEAVLDWADFHELRSGENPARWRGHLAHKLPETSKVAVVKHHPALPYAAIPQFMNELRDRIGSGPRALEFLILTAARTGEVVGARWSEIDLTAALWTIPATRMKSGKEHRVPLSPPAVALLRALPTEPDFVFIAPSAGRGITNMAMNATLKRMGRRGQFTVHGFRSTFMDWAHECTGFDKVVIDMALAHAVGDKVEAAYRRADLLDKRRRLMVEWGKYCSTSPLSTGEVLQLQSGR
jgi:integrase